MHLPLSRPERGVLFVVSGPSGVGKSTLVSHLRRRIPHLGFSVSATTRAPRPGERDGVDYHFVDEARFKHMVQTGQFYEHALVYGRHYGTPRSSVDPLLDDGWSVILDIDVLGSQQVRQIEPDAVHIFILPPSVEALEARLRARGTDSDEVIARRMTEAADQLFGAPSYDYLVVNDNLDTACVELESIAVAEQARRHRRTAALSRVLDPLGGLPKTPGDVR